MATDAASASLSAAVLMMPSPSRSHCTAAPAMKMLPSTAKRCLPAMRDATVVSSPFCENTGVVARVLEDEAAGAVRVLRAARVEAALPEERRLLVAGDAGDRDRAPEDRGIGLGDDAAAVDDSRQHRARDVAARRACGRPSAPSRRL